jgi:N-acetylneuraminic acid mutarotase
LAGSIPLVNFVGASNTNYFMGAAGNTDSTTASATLTVNQTEWRASSYLGEKISGLNIAFANVYFSGTTNDTLGTYTVQPLSLTINSDSTKDVWNKYSGGCTTGKTLLVVHGMFSSVEQSFSTGADGTAIIQPILAAGNYQSALGFDYDWMQKVDSNGIQLASFLSNFITECPSTPIDIEAHSEGVPVSLYALTQLSENQRNSIKHFIALGGPIMGTPMATDGQALACGIFNWTKLNVPEQYISGTVTSILQSALNAPFVSQLAPSSPTSTDILNTIRTSLSADSVNNTPQIFVVAGNNPDAGGSASPGPQLKACGALLNNDGFPNSDGFIPVQSALAVQPFVNGSAVLKVYPFAPFSTAHTGLTSYRNVVSSVGKQVANAFVSPSLNLSNLSDCTDSVVCSGNPGTVFLLSGTGFSTTDINKGYELDYTGNVAEVHDFSTPDGSIHANVWQDATSCSVPPATVVLFAESPTTQQQSNAVTAEVVAGNCVTPANNPVPTITSPLLPSSLPAGSAAQTLTINGTGFLSSSTVMFNGISHAATFVSTTQLTILLTSPDLSTAGTYPVVVTNPAPGGGASSPVSFTVTSAAPPNSNEWTWVSGSNMANAFGVYGMQGSPASNNVPGARYGQVSWADSTGNGWLFGGYHNNSSAQGSLNDLWEFNPVTRTWMWVSGGDITNASGVYGTQGVPAATNVPGARMEFVSWIDPSDNLWLFGGLGSDSTGPVNGVLNDLWEFNPTTKLWIWISGSDKYGQAGNYGSRGVSVPSDVPPARAKAVGWTDPNGNFWLFGGDGNGNLDRLNDLWEFSSNTKVWTWMSGSNSSNASGVYGSKGVSATSNVPGAREQAVSWIDVSGNLWLFGGGGYDSAGHVGFLNDLWEFIPALNTWTWMSGSNVVNATAIYGTQGVPDVNNVPGAMNGAASWTDTGGNLWLLGGGQFVDLWKFDPVTETWTWVNGSHRTDRSCTMGAAGQFGVYGTLGVPAVTNMPGTRVEGASWSDLDGNLWLFGGLGCDSNGNYGELNDLWRYQP